ncbi:tetratricopeptide repeat protein [Pseudoalteromonas denitrificans]|uniref:MSHA biogenesis protein MshN n=1 Tax=Pseudoalteromonas denitrificans DSM 6059 TaxID=1123010 RepID=A0A1I1DW48_9GAMM|nr:tetratricopeptide repeat protein [Pseudoalteromonas denitrificans]SFB77248.1 MSHA biogenesis protein MshN [Pseudoalteromonas denitrificans DSM 6059]
MSVINKMLKDIEQRESNSALHLDPTVKVENVRDNSKIIQRLAIFTIVIIIAIGAYWLIPKKTIIVTQKVAKTEPLITEPQVINPDIIEENSFVTNHKEPATPSDQVLKTEITKVESQNAKTKQIRVPVKPAQDEPVQDNPIKVTETTPVNKSSNANSKIVKPDLPKNVKTSSKVRQISTKTRAENWFNQGKEAFQFGLIEDAISALNKALVLMPTHIEARSLLAAAYYGRDQKPQAESILRHGLSLNPDVMRWRILLAKILIEQNNYQSVEPVLPKRYEFNANTDFWILKGTAAQQLGQHLVAKHCFSKLTQLQPAEAKWWLALGASNDALGEYSNAKRFYLVALELGGLSPNANSHAKNRLEKIGVL